MSEKQVSDLIIVIMVAVMVAVMAANTAKQTQRSRSRQQKKKKRLHRAIDLEPVRMVCHTDIEPAAEEEELQPDTKPKPDRGRLEGIQGYPHKESAHHRPYNPPRKRYSLPLLLFPYLSQIFFLTKNCCSIIPYTEVRYDK